jgi:protein TonB
VGKFQVNLHRNYLTGHKLLDAAAERIVRMAAPYARFPDNIRRDVDVLVITRTWHFEQGDRIMTE